MRAAEFEGTANKTAARRPVPRVSPKVVRQRPLRVTPPCVVGMGTPPYPL